MRFIKKTVCLFSFCSLFVLETFFSSFSFSGIVHCSLFVVSQS
jgi:hypothetical protein